MKIVNRCAITVEPRQAFMEWAQQLQPAQPLPPAAFAPGLYLLPLYDSRKDAIELLQQGYEEIFFRSWRPGRRILKPGPARAAWPRFMSGLPFVSTTWSATKGRNHWRSTRWTNPLEDLRSVINDSPGS